MPLPLDPKYPLDPTGTSPVNLVTGEQWTLTNRTVRAIAPIYGAFFTASLKIVDQANNQVLSSAQYYPAELYVLATKQFGQEVCGIIIITDTTVSNNVTIQYQAVGGDLGTSLTGIAEMINDLSLDDRPISWPNITNKPTQFPPSPHQHDAGDVYGFEYLVQAIERVRMAILVGDDVSHDAILQYVDSQIAMVNNSQTDDQTFFLSQLG